MRAYWNTVEKDVYVEMELSNGMPWEGRSFCDYVDSFKLA